MVEGHVMCCALSLVAQVLRRAAEIQTEWYAAGEFALVPWLAPAMRLHTLIRAGVCELTAVLELEELPDLEPDLALLPEPYREALRGAIQAEQLGRMQLGA